MYLFVVIFFGNLYVITYIYIIRYDYYDIAYGALYGH